MAMINVIWALLVVLTYTANVCDAQCKPRWIQFRQKCYYYNETGAEFPETRKFCSSLNATLVSIHSKEENDFIFNITRSNSTGFADVWLGAKSISPTEMAFEWLDGSDRNYTNWKPKEPNCDFDGAVCCAQEMTATKQWQFYTCFYKNRQLCQQPFQHDLNIVSKIADPRVTVSVVLSTPLPTIKVSPTTRFTEEEDITTSSTGSCSRERGWHTFGKKCFFLNVTRATFNANEQLCASMNSTMVSIHSQEEEDFIHSLVYLMHGVLSSDEIWLGSKRARQWSRSYRWTDGTKLDFANWFVNEPNCNQTTRSSACCAIELRHNRKWYDIDCGTKNIQLCQMHRLEEFDPVMGRFEQETNRSASLLQQINDKVNILEDNLSSCLDTNLLIGVTVLLLIVIVLGIYGFKKLSHMLTFIYTRDNRASEPKA